MSSVTASASRTTTASPVALRVSPAREHADARFEPQRAGHGTAVGGGAGAVAVDAAHHEIAVRSRFDGRALRRLHPRLERDLSRAAGGQPHDDDLVGRAGEHLARERHAAAGEGHVSRCRRQIEIAPVVLDRIHLWKRQREIADRLVRHLRERLRHHLRFDELSPPPGTCARRAGAGLRAARLSRRDSPDRTAAPPTACPRSAAAARGRCRQTPSHRAGRCQREEREPTRRCRLGDSAAAHPAAAADDRRPVRDTRG